MNYLKHYQLLIDRACSRKKDINEYYENHHIIPQCLGGIDANNIAALTAREHFIAHLLLVKIYPNNPKLVKAATMMLSFNQSQINRSQNQLYEWLRKKLAQTMSKSQTGSGNSQFGKIWVYNETEKINKKIHPNDEYEYSLTGWSKGRKLNWINKRCVVCDVEILIGSSNRKYCSKQCKDVTRVNVFTGREDELREQFQKHKSLNKALKVMNLPGAVGHWYYLANKILNGPVMATPSKR